MSYQNFTFILLFTCLVVSTVPPSLTFPLSRHGLSSPFSIRHSPQRRQPTLFLLRLQPFLNRHQMSSAEIFHTCHRGACQGQVLHRLSAVPLVVTARMSSYCAHDLRISSSYHHDYQCPRSRLFECHSRPCLQTPVQRIQCEAVRVCAWLVGVEQFSKVFIKLYPVIFVEILVFGSIKM